MSSSRTTPTTIQDRSEPDDEVDIEPTDAVRAGESCRTRTPRRSEVRPRRLCRGGCGGRPSRATSATGIVIHCYSGYENKVRHNLEQRIESMGMKGKIFDVVVPTEEEIEVKDGKRRTGGAPGVPRLCWCR